MTLTVSVTEWGHKATVWRLSVSFWASMWAQRGQNTISVRGPINLFYDAAISWAWEADIDRRLPVPRTIYRSIAAGARALTVATVMLGTKSRTYLTFITFGIEYSIIQLIKILFSASLETIILLTILWRFTVYYFGKKCICNICNWGNNYICYRT